MFSPEAINNFLDKAASASKPDPGEEKTNPTSNKIIVGEKII